MCSPVVSASDPGNRSVLKGFSRACEMPHQLCDILLQIERDLHLVCIFIISLVHSHITFAPHDNLFWTPIIVECHDAILTWNCNVQFIELFDVRMRLLGSHQLQNAATATCAALCLRNQGGERELEDYSLSHSVVEVLFNTDFVWVCNLCFWSKIVSPWRRLYPTQLC